MFDGPPWQLTNCSVYRFYVCPEGACDFKSTTESHFHEHMNGNHEVIDIKTGNDFKNIKVIDVRQLDKLINTTSVQITKSSTNNKAKIIPFAKKRPKTTSGVTFDCRSCGFLFDTISELRKHIDFEHSESTTVQTTTDSNNHGMENDVFNDAGDDPYEPEYNNSDDDYNVPPPNNSSSPPPQPPSTNNKRKVNHLGYTCQICSSKFESHDILREHLEHKHVALPPIYNRSDIQTKVRCHHCQQDYRSYHYLKSHCEREHKKMPIKFTKRTVKILDEVTGDEVLIKEVDGDATTYKCDHCPYTSHLSDLRGLHMQKEHNDASKVVWFKCDKCNFKCRQRRTIAKHKQDHKSGVLEQKGKMIFKFVNTKEETGLFQFTDNFLDKEPEDMKIKPTKVVLQCQICDGPREFNYFHALKAHFEGFHGGQKLFFKKRVIKGTDGLEDLFEKEDGDDRVYSCQYCDYVSHMADLCGIHMEKEHNDTSKLVYVKCDKCTYVSKTRGNLINHKRLVHENYKPKKCSHCDRRFSTKALLEEHMMRSHNPEGILCEDCGKKFSSPKLLKRHELWHHNPEQAGGPVPCHICGKISMHKYALQKHILRVHRKAEKNSIPDGGGAPCHVCGKIYAEKKSLKSHLAKVHSVYDN